MTIRSPKELAIFAVSERKRLGLTQSEVAQRVGLQQKTISAFENTPESVLLSTAFLILSALHVDLKVSKKGENADEANKWNEEW